MRVQQDIHPEISGSFSDLNLDSSNGYQVDLTRHVSESGLGKFLSESRAALVSQLGESEEAVNNKTRSNETRSSTAVISDEVIANPTIAHAQAIVELANLGVDLSSLHQQKFSLRLLSQSTFAKINFATYVASQVSAEVEKNILAKDSKDSRLVQPVTGLIQQIPVNLTKKLSFGIEVGEQSNPNSDSELVIDLGSAVVQISDLTGQQQVPLTIYPSDVDQYILDPKAQQANLFATYDYQINYYRELDTELEAAKVTKEDLDVDDETFARIKNFNVFDQLLQAQEYKQKLSQVREATMRKRIGRSSILPPQASKIAQGLSVQELEKEAVLTQVSIATPPNTPNTPNNSIGLTASVASQESTPEVALVPKTDLAAKQTEASSNANSVGFAGKVELANGAELANVESNPENESVSETTNQAADEQFADLLADIDSVISEVASLDFHENLETVKLGSEVFVNSATQADLTELNSPKLDSPELNSREFILSDFTSSAHTVAESVTSIESIKETSDFSAVRKSRIDLNVSASAFDPTLTQNLHHEELATLADFNIEVDLENKFIFDDNFEEGFYSDEETDGAVLADDQVADHQVVGEQLVSNQVSEYQLTSPEFTGNNFSASGATISEAGVTHSSTVGLKNTEEQQQTYGFTTNGDLYADYDPVFDEVVDEVISQVSPASQVQVSAESVAIASESTSDAFVQADELVEAIDKILDSKSNSTQGMASAASVVKGDHTVSAENKPGTVILDSNKSSPYANPRRNRVRMVNADIHHTVQVETNLQLMDGELFRPIPKLEQGVIFPPMINNRAKHPEDYELYTAHELESIQKRGTRGLGSHSWIKSSNFFVANSNRVAYEHLMDLAHKVVNKETFSGEVIILQGLHGVGKTHLVNAFINHLLVQNVRAESIYMYNQFNEEFRSAIVNESIDALSASFLARDINIIDDFQKGKESRRFIAELIDQVKGQQNKILIIVTSVPPEKLYTKEEGFCLTRFFEATNLHIQMPDYALRKRVVTETAVKERIKLSPLELETLLIATANSDLRSCMGFVYTYAHNDKSFAEMINEKFKMVVVEKIPAQVIFKLVQNETGYSLDTIVEGNITHGKFSLKMLIIFLLQHYSGLRIGELSHILQQAHSSVQNAIKNARRLGATNDESFRGMISNILNGAKEFIVQNRQLFHTHACFIEDGEDFNYGGKEYNAQYEFAIEDWEVMVEHRKSEQLSYQQPASTLSEKEIEPVGASLQQPPKKIKMAKGKSLNSPPPTKTKSSIKAAR